MPNFSPPRPNLLPATFYRGGTSNGILISGRNLPGWRQIRSEYPDISKLDLKHCARILEPLYGAIMGSPDPWGRQLNGMGGGLSSLSKAVIVDSRHEAEGSEGGWDLDYLFVQIGIRDGRVDLAGNCGNMTSAVAPFALDAGLIDSTAQRKLALSKSTQTPEQSRSQPLTFRLRNLNTNRLIDATTHAYLDSTTSLPRFEPRGDYHLDGVPGYSSPITLSFLSPGGAKTGKALPTGNAIDVVEYETGTTIRASLLDISNPGVFIHGSDVGWDPKRTLEELNANTDLMMKLELIRRAGAKMMALDPDTPSIPKIVMLFPAQKNDVDITCQALSMEQAHKAAPMTLSLNLGVACMLNGTVANELVRPIQGRETVVIGHPSGKVEVGAEIRPGTDEIVSAKVVRTARCLMEGWVNTAPSDKTDFVE